jgi:hypothetical protein
MPRGVEHVHFTMTIRCPKCGHQFAVCVHAEKQPNPDQTYRVLCPNHNGVLTLVARALQQVESCPPGAIEVEKAAPGGGSGRRWWRFWK